MKILFSGGGTLGPVTPLIAIKEIIAEAYPEATFLWIGTKHGPEKVLVEQERIPFTSITAGKFRRYASPMSFVDVFRIIFGFFQSWRFLKREKPDLCISAGGFVSVPVHAAARFCGIKTWIHQQDILPGLANVFMSQTATKITCAVDITRQRMSQLPITHIGNPIRKFVLTGERTHGLKRFGLSGKKPIVFVTGGGTGAARINQLIEEALPFLENTIELIHLSGVMRERDSLERAQETYTWYHMYPSFSEEMADAYAVADLVISRGGFGTMTELAALKKATIFIPKAGHQEMNTAYINEAGGGIVLDETSLSGKELASIIQKTLASKRLCNSLGEKFHQALPRAKTNEILTLVRRLVS